MKKLILLISLLMVLLVGCTNPETQAQIREVKEIIKSIPLPTVYSEWDGTKLQTKDPEVQVVGYDSATGDIGFKITCEYYNPNTPWWDLRINGHFAFVQYKDNGHTAILGYVEDGYVEDFDYFQYFTLSFCRENQSKLFWRY